MVERFPASSEVKAVAARTVVTLVDDDESVRESLPDLLEELGFATRTFSSALEFLESNEIRVTHCLILDVAMPGMSGPELQRELESRGEKVPIIFITARADETVCWQLIAGGAVDCLSKPFSELELRAALEKALQRDTFG